MSPINEEKGGGWASLPGNGESGKGEPANAELGGDRPCWASQALFVIHERPSDDLAYADARTPRDPEDIHLWVGFSTMAEN